jgi:hypothetical protein
MVPAMPESPLIFSTLSVAEIGETEFAARLPTAFAADCAKSNALPRNALRQCRPGFLEPAMWAGSLRPGNVGLFS